MSSATSSGAAESAQTFISIHAITRSATRVFTSLIHLNPKFQSTHSRGVRHFAMASLLSTNGISIHALTRSATRSKLSLNAYYHNFNPRTHEECDILLWLLCFPQTEFQSTHSRGVRPEASYRSMHTITISIHALTRSATKCNQRYIRKYLISIHALTRSATRGNHKQVGTL